MEMMFAFSRMVKLAQVRLTPWVLMLGRWRTRTLGASSLELSSTSLIKSIFNMSVLKWASSRSIMKSLKIFCRKATTLKDRKSLRPSRSRWTHGSTSSTFLRRENQIGPSPKLLVTKSRQDLTVFCSWLFKLAIKSRPCHLLILQVQRESTTLK